MTLRRQRGDDCVALSAIYINIKYIYVCVYVCCRQVSLCLSSSSSVLFFPAIQLKRDVLD